MAPAGERLLPTNVIGGVHRDAAEVHEMCRVGTDLKVAVLVEAWPAGVPVVPLPGGDRTDAHAQRPPAIWHPAAGPAIAVPDMINPVGQFTAAMTRHVDLQAAPHGEMAHERCLRASRFRSNDATATPRDCPGAA